SAWTAGFGGLSRAGMWSDVRYSFTGRLLPPATSMNVRRWGSGWAFWCTRSFIFLMRRAGAACFVSFTDLNSGQELAIIWKNRDQEGKAGASQGDTAGIDCRHCLSAGRGPLYSDLRGSAF